MQADSQLASFDREVRFFVCGRADLIFGLVFLVDIPRNRQRTTGKASWTEENLQSAKTAIEGGSLNPNFFTDQDFLAASLMPQESKKNAEIQDPNVQNFQDAQSDGMAITSGHSSPLAGP